jgi:hypothetical protein
MAMVTLESIMAEDKNCYGLLNPEWKVEVKPGTLFTEHSNVTNEELMEITDNLFKKVKISDLYSDHVINVWEWVLLESGILAQTGIYWINNKCEFLTIFELDIREYLKEFSDEKLTKLGELVFRRWTGNGGKEVNQEKFNRFINNIKSC